MIFAQENQVTFFDNLTLDRWLIPFGEWFDQMVDWIDNNLQTLLDIIEWPFNTLITLVVDDFLIQVSWVWVVLGMGLIAALVRNIKVGAFVVVALTICGLLGPGYWIETARTIGFIAVAVFFCVLIGIPVGVAAGRVDGVWQTIRPLLDAMQVVHSFVYMIPFIFFWGVGEVSATMVTMIFAIPPLIRLTNLGIRQVPGDVVEAARAHGAPEWRVLFDVQIPLARPAIMTGINQTLLLAISMLGIAAIMGAGGLGRLLFRSLSNQDVALAASAGLAFFLVAVVLDRISQREGTDQGNLFRRIHLAWKHRRDPEELLPDGEAVVSHSPVDRYERLRGQERLGMAVAALGGVIAAVSVFLTWSVNAGWISAYGVRADEDQAGMAFDGLNAAGGSFFGIVVLALGLFVIASALVAFVWPGRGPRWLTVDGALIAGLAATVTAAAFMLANPSPLAVDPELGFGVVLAVIGGAVASVGSILWIRVAPHSPLHPLRADVQWGRLIGAFIGLLVVVLAAFAGWAFDERTDVVISPELQAEIEELREQASDDPTQQSVIANQIASLIAGAQATSTPITNGVEATGPQLGLSSMFAAVLAMLASIVGAGVFGSQDRRLWSWSAVAAGLALGVAAIGFAWIFTFVRFADIGFIVGVGAFLSLMGGFFMLASTMSVLKEFRRSKLYDDDMSGDHESEVVEEQVDELV